MWKRRRKKRIEEVKEMVYLGYKMQKNRGCGKQLDERKRKVLVVAKGTWSIEERLFKNNYYERRIRMFQALVKSVELYGAEI